MIISRIRLQYSSEIFIVQQIYLNCEKLVRINVSIVQQKQFVTIRFIDVCPTFIIAQKILRIFLLPFVSDQNNLKKYSSSTKYLILQLT